jgi:hypothetical protein
LDGVTVEYAAPFTVYKRGLWFSGDDFARINGIALSHTFTLTFWIRPTAIGNLFSVQTSTLTESGSEDLLNIKLVESGSADLFAVSLIWSEFSLDNTPDHSVSILKVE